MNALKIKSRGPHTFVWCVVLLLSFRPREGCVHSVLQQDSGHSSSGFCPRKGVSAKTNKK